MSGSQDKSQKTEKPTPQKLRQAKKQGQVAKSKDVTAFITTLSLTLLMLTVFSSGWEYVMVFAQSAMELGDDSMDVVLSSHLHHAFFILVTLILPILIVAFCSAVMGNIGQTGLIFSWHPVKPDINKLNPVSGFQRIFGVKNLVEFLRSSVKLIVLVVSIYFVITYSISDLFHVVECGVECAVSMWYLITLRIVVLVIIVFFCLSMFDFWFQRHHFMTEQMMTRDEVKKDHKASEGDPLIKNARKQLHRETAAENVDLIVKDATLILLAKTSLVVLRYKYGETPLPILTLVRKQGQMRDVIYKAKKHDVPIHEDVQLVAKIMKKTKLNEYIPVALISEVAAIFASRSLV